MRKKFAKLAAASLSISMMLSAVPIQLYAETLTDEVSVQMLEEVPMQEQEVNQEPAVEESKQEANEQEEAKREPSGGETTSQEAVNDQPIMNQEVIVENNEVQEPVEEIVMDEVIEEEPVVIEEMQFVDVMAETQTGLEGFINRMYSTCLGRKADSNGLQFWVNSLKTGAKKGADVGQFFIQSEELQKKNLSTEAYIDVLYRAFFDRQPEATGKAFWVNEINSGKSKDSVLAEFINSAEFQKVCDSYGIERGSMSTAAPVEEGTPVQKFVKRFYSKCMGRVPSQGEVDFWVGQLENKTYTGKAFAQYFVSSEEFDSKNLQGEVYIEEMYKIFFDRTPDASGKSFWVSVLASQGKQAIFEGFVSSNEFKASCNEAGIVYEQVAPVVPSAEQVAAANESRLVELINVERRNAGLPDLKVESKAMEAARLWAGQRAAGKVSVVKGNDGKSKVVSQDYGDRGTFVFKYLPKTAKGFAESTWTGAKTADTLIGSLETSKIFKDYGLNANYTSVAVGYVAQKNQWVIFFIK